MFFCLFCFARVPSSEARNQIHVTVVTRATVVTTDGSLTCWATSEIQAKSLVIGFIWEKWALSFMFSPKVHIHLLPLNSKGVLLSQGKREGFRGVMCRSWAMNPVVYIYAYKKHLPGWKADCPGLEQQRTGMFGRWCALMVSQNVLSPGATWRPPVKAPAWRSSTSCPQEFWENRESINKKGLEICQ